MLTRSLTISDTVHRAVAAGRERLLDLQHADGRWEGIVRSDPGVTAQFLLAARHVERVDPAVERALLAHLEGTQGPDGGWAGYPGGPPSLDVTLACYAALRFAGRHPDSALMRGARDVIITAGGIEAVGFIARFPLVFWGQIPLAGLTYLSPKMLFLPQWIHPNLFDLGIFLQAVLAVELLLKQRGVRLPPDGQMLDELRTGRPLPRAAMSGTGGMIAAASRAVDQVIPARGLDRRAADWLADRQNGDGLWAGMALFTTRAMMALHATDPGRYRSAVDTAVAGMLHFQVSEGQTRWQQAGRSPVLDTAIAVTALGDAGAEAHEARMTRALRWLLAVRSAAGWSFSRDNATTPDTDTTLHVLEALSAAPHAVPGVDEAIGSGTGWMLDMQDRRGGWAMWSPGLRMQRSLVRELERNGAVDTPTPDVTARVVRALARLRGRVSTETRRRIDTAMARAVVYLQQTQRPDGTWPGRWAVNFAYGTAQGLTALAAAGDATGAATRARRFLLEIQQGDGGWGESPASDDVGTFVSGPSTITQTALALLGLLATPGVPEAAVVRGTAFLLDRARGGWNDETFCQTLLPGRLYFQNSLLPTSLALMTLARAARRGAGTVQT